jgi:wyosine [tRNA(Phe)-imidazoG37] synthetase (radical SAM superfamily)
LESERNGSIYRDSPFNLLAPSERGVRDIAFSGDGEPTAFPRFGEAARIAARARNRFGLHTSKLILLTDAAYLSKPAVKAALSVLDANNGEIWAKLDAGTEAFFRIVNRPNVTLERILENILAAARLRPVTVQSLFFRINGVLPPAAEIEAYCERLNEMTSAGAKFSLVQLYTIARQPAEPFVSPLSDIELDSIAASVRARVSIPVEVFY